MNKSVKNIARIAKKYSYRMRIIYVNRDKAFLSIFDNFLKSPYPHHMTSNMANIKYILKYYYEHEL